jgi:hypothetical protein
MKKLIVLLLVLGVTSSAFGLPNVVVQNLVKSTSARAANAPNSQDWFTAANWGGAVGVPQNDTATQCNGVTLYGSSATSYNSSGATDSIIIAGGNAATGELRVGSTTPNTSTVTGVPAALTMNSGTLTIGSIYSTTAYVTGGSGFMSVGSDSAAAGSAGRNGLFYMNGGDLQALNGQGSITIGNGNTTGLLYGTYGKMWMTGGTIESLTFQIGKNSGVEGDVYLSGGTITTNNFFMRAGGGTANVLLDITGSGSLVISGDKTSLIDGYIDNGWIKSNGVAWTDYANVSYNAGTNQTTLIVPEPATICLLGIGLFGLIRRK